jgi:hypothetical protein
LRPFSGKKGGFSLKYVKYYRGVPEFWDSPYITFADGIAKTSFLRKLKNEFSIFKSRKRDLTIGDVAHAR